jgi:hypothetical protein
MRISKSKHPEFVSLPLLAILWLSTCSKSAPTSPDQPSQPQTCNISGIVYYSTTPIDGVEICLDWLYSSYVMKTTTHGGGFYQFNNVVPCRCMYLDKYPFGIYAMRPEWFVGFDKQLNAIDVTKDLYLYKRIKTVSDGRTFNSSHPTITWEANPEARKYVIDIVRTGESNKTIDQGETSSSNYTVSIELTPGKYGFRILAYDSFDHLVGDTDFSNVAAYSHCPFSVSY